MHDQTLRQHLYDVLRDKDWPRAYSGRVLRNAFIQRWERPDYAADVDVLRSRFSAAVTAEDYDIANVIVGESIGLIHSIDSAAALIAQITSDANRILGRAASALRMPASAAL